jgi:hypothetical protein
LEFQANAGGAVAIWLPFLIGFSSTYLYGFSDDQQLYRVAGVSLASFLLFCGTLYCGFLIAVAGRDETDRDLWLAAI